MNHPLPEVNEAAVREVLEVAETYYANRDRLIYAFKGMTFLAGFPLHDPAYDNRGNIDCSTYMQLVLQGIPYEQSPYVTGESTLRPNPTYGWTQQKLLMNLQRDAGKRRANEIARSYYEDGVCFTDPGEARPGDLIFYRAPEEVVSFYAERGCFMEICHVALMSETPGIMYHSTGLPSKEEQENESMQAIQRTSIFQDRTPLLFARPDYGSGTFGGPEKRD